MLADIHLVNFRSYKNASFEFSPNVNIIVGPNASGKTNLLEAILVLAKGKSYRAKDGELIRFKKEWARLDSRTTNGNTRTIKLTPYTKPQKILDLDGKEYRRMTIANSIPVVIFEPNHLQLLSGSPERRRDYVDDLLEQTVPGYIALRRQYLRTLAQRNNLLKQQGASVNQLFPWNIKLSELGGQIVKERISLVKNLNKGLESLYKELSHTNTVVNLEYLNTWPEDLYETLFLKDLERNMETDKIKGFTSLGPHREDIEPLFNNKQAQLVASRGETRTLVLALKIQEANLIESQREEKPILLLDDVFSELDGSRRHSLVSYLKNNQAFVTTTDADLISKNFTKQANVIAIQGS